MCGGSKVQFPTPVLSQKPTTPQFHTFFYLPIWGDFKASRRGKARTTNINPQTIREKLNYQKRKEKKEREKKKQKVH